MPELLKNVYTPVFFEAFQEAVSHILPRYDHSRFLQQVFDASWAGKELKQRMRHIATILHHHIPGAYPQQVDCLIQLIAALEKQNRKGGFEYMFLPDFVEQYGQHDLPTSLAAMESMTQFVSCEFAIRPFLLRYPEEVMKQLLVWSRHAHQNVRRFASEGCRPRLPWAMAIPKLKKDPSPILPILENLKADPSLFVRKSVANNLNDIARDHPEVVVQLVKNWSGVSAETDWIIRHGCRTLLKNAHPATYALFQIDTSKDIRVLQLELSHNTLKIGERLGFSFQVQGGDTVTKIRLEYAVYYVKATGKQSRKIFQLTETLLQPRKIYSFKKEQRFQEFTTRKHYAGRHKLAIVVNGKELAAAEFDLLK